MSEADLFKSLALERGILDPPGVHSQFANGGHGRKLDFGKIEADAELYGFWVRLTCNELAMRFNPLPRAVLSIANGTNRLTCDVARELGIIALLTEKVSSNRVALTSESRPLVPRDGHIIGFEDVGTTGGGLQSGVESAIACGALNVSGLVTWQRCKTLEALDSSGVPYQSIIVEVLPTYTLDECRSIGYCALEWELIEH